MESIITPIERLKSIFPTDALSGRADTESVENASMFKDIYNTAINNVIETDYAAVINTENLATGDVDDLHNLGIDNMKSYLSVSMLVQMRNRALESYNQIMQITV